jgi:Tfp pilus assembly protein PilV
MVRTYKTSRGVSLVEAMVALAVMAFGMLTVVGVQSTLRLNADIAKQRSEATRIAQETMEKHRAFLVVDAVAGVQSWAGSIVNAGPADVTDLVTNTTFTVESKLATGADPTAKVLQVFVRWPDRSGQPQQVTMTSAIAAAAPALSGTLAVRPGTAAVAPVRRPYGRHPAIPVQARDFGSGTSGWVPPFKGTMLFLFNNVTGLVTGVCTFNYETETDNITPEEIASCNNTVNGQLLSGFVRFQRRTDGADLNATDVEDPIGPALNLRLRITLTSSGHPFGSFCIDDANSLTLGDGTLRFATYYCVIYSNSSGLWSGTTSIEPRNGFNTDFWVVSDDSSSGSDADQRFRVCRYTPAANDSQAITNQDHPRNYTDVNGSLPNQNFVVISSRKHCPTDVPASPATGDFVNTNTLQHQPAPS